VKTGLLNSDLKESPLWVETNYKSMLNNIDNYFIEKDFKKSKNEPFYVKQQSITNILIVTLYCRLLSFFGK